MALLKPKIVVVPLGEVDFMMINRLATNIGPIYGRSVDILKGMKIPEEAYNVIRNQHYATIILNKLERTKTSPRELVLGACEEDIYLPDEPYIIGYSDTSSGTAIVSLYRIRQEFYGLPEDEMKIYSRLFKQSIHQLAHLMDMTSCRNPRCVNYYSQDMMDIDNKGERFCDICKRQLVEKK
ncbi:MAG: archaemetzincin [candidate division Zixibacteria bacterium]|nr:archaemetzincin [candidate division Zixibacteria bacterium]